MVDVHVIVCAVHRYLMVHTRYHVESPRHAAFGYLARNIEEFFLTVCMQPMNASYHDLMDGLLACAACTRVCTYISAQRVE